MTDVVAIETAAVDENASPSLPVSKPGTGGTLSGPLVVLSYVIVPVAFILVWDLAVRYDAVPSTLIAAPLDVAERLVDLIVSGKLEHQVAVSLGRLVQGFLYGSVLGIAVGTAVGASRLASRLIEPSLLTMIPIPAVAWVPLLIVLFGIGETSKVLLIALGSFCTLFLHTAHGIRSADRKLVEVAYVLGKSRAVLIRRVLLPAALPEIFAAARIAMALSWALLIVAEVIASSSGLGWFIWDARNFNRPSDMIVGMIAIGVLGKLSDALLGQMSHFATSWRDTYGG
jgi:ABC-type nitrate/sulfonate/bicarbonate transport system permease component